MVKLNPGNLDAKLARLNTSTRSRRWRKRARQHLLKDAGATPVKRHSHKIKGGYVCEKVGFLTEEAAKLALEFTAANPQPDRRETRYYPCPLCGKFHLTSMEVKRYDHIEETDLEESPSRQENWDPAKPGAERTVRIKVTVIGGGRFHITPGTGARS